MNRTLRTILLGGLALLAAPVLYALPATLSLPSGQRPGLEPLTLAQAARQLAATGESGWALVEAARALVAERMAYCRRNSFDPYPRAFERGYGYCQQQAHALADLLRRLGFDARVVTALRNRFPDGSVGGHAWVRVTVGGASREIDSIHYDRAAGRIDFTPLTRVFEYTPAFRLFAGWSSAALNAHRYYRTGKDRGG